jgi:hypothetical protein
MTQNLLTKGSSKGVVCPLCKEETDHLSIYHLKMDGMEATLTVCQNCITNFEHPNNHPYEAELRYIKPFVKQFAKEHRWRLRTIWSCRQWHIVMGRNIFSLFYFNWDVIELYHGFDEERSLIIKSYDKMSDSLSIDLARFLNTKDFAGYRIKRISLYQDCSGGFTTEKLSDNLSQGGRLPVYLSEAGSGKEGRL